MSFDKAAVRYGNLLKKEAEETPNSFATEGGASSVGPTGQLDRKSEQRMAGPGGAFAMKMMQDPQLQQRVANWSQQFSQSNQGMQFNQAKMMMGGQG